MREKLLELWLAAECSKKSFKSWDSDDEGRLNVIVGKVRELVKLKNEVKDLFEKWRYEL